MFKSTLFRHPFRVQSLLRKPPRRCFATESPSSATSQSRIQRFNRRMPKFLHKYTNALASAPVSHITSFLILHELTAIIPLFGLAATFHYTHWLPTWFTEGAIVLQGVERFGKYFKRKGWIRSEDAAEAEHELQMRKRDQVWDIGEGGVRLVVEFATAYAITKVLLPVRIVASVSATPWFAKRAVVPMTEKFTRLFNKGKVKGNGSGGAGTGAVDGGAMPKSGSTGTKP